MSKSESGLTARDRAVQMIATHGRESALERAHAIVRHCEAGTGGRTPRELGFWCDVTEAIHATAPAEPVRTDHFPRCVQCGVPARAVTASMAANVMHRKGALEEWREGAPVPGWGVQCGEALFCSLACAGVFAGEAYFAGYRPRA